MIRRFVEYFAIAWLLMPVTLLAQGARGSIQGVVCEIKTCKPIDRVQVWLVHPGSEAPVKTMRTEVSGEFAFFDLEPGRYMVRTRADSFITRSGPPSVVIANGERIENIKVELTSLGTISGSVYSENGEPVAGARVEALAELLNSPFSVLDRMVAVPQGSAVTDNRGDFRLSALEANEYYVRVSYQANREDGKTYSTTYYPATTDPELAVKVSAAPGSESNGINVRLVPGGVTLRGTFISQSSAPARAIPILIPRSPAVFVMPLLPESRDSMNSNETETSFEIRGAPRGSYYLYAITRFDAIGPQWVRMPIDVGSENVNDIRIVLSSTGTIKGRVRTARDAIDGDQLDLSRLTFNLSFAELTMPLGGAPAAARPNKAGEFRYEGLAEAKVFLRPSYLDPGWFISEMQLDGEDVMASGFSAKPGAESTLEVTISNAGGAIAGILKGRQDKPMKSARFVLLPEPRLRGNPVLLKTGVANADGDFTINGIRPGNYTLLAFPDEDQFTPAFLRDRDLLEKNEAFGHLISIGAGQTIRADVTVIPDPRR